MTFKEIQELIKLFGKSEIGSLDIKNKDFNIKLKSNQSCQKVINAPANTVSAPVVTSVAPTPVAPTGKTETTSESKGNEGAPTGKTINASMIGTFYRSAGPDKDPFVKVGDKVEAGQVICIIEAMKLFNEIESEVSGTITKVLINDATPVEYDQPLFEIE